MNINFLPMGRSESSKSIVQTIPGLKWIVSLVKILFGTFDWCLAEVVDGCRPMLTDINVGEPAYKITGFPIGSNLYKRSNTLQVPLQFKALISNKGLQSRRSQRFDWSAVRVITESLIKFGPWLPQWRDNMGWRGPPWALFAAINIVRLQE